MKLSLVGGRSGRELTKKIANNLSLEPVDTIIQDFSNKEIFTKYKETIRGRDVFITQCFNSDPNKDLVETLILADAAFAASARRITLVLPTIYGSRQDRKSSPRTPITISTMAKLFKSVEADRVITVSLHSPQSAAGFYSAGLRFDNISSARLFLPLMEEMNKDKDFVIVAPDVGALGKASHYAEYLGCDIAFANKKREKANKSEITAFVGDVKDRNCFIVDDMIDTGGSLVNVANMLKEEGAKEINCLATHLILSKDAKQKLEVAPINKIFGSDSVHHEELPDKVEVVSLSELLSQVIYRIHKDKSVGACVEEITKR